MKLQVGGDYISFLKQFGGFTRVPRKLKKIIKKCKNACITDDKDCSIKESNTVTKIDYNEKTNEFIFECVEYEQ